MTKKTYADLTATTTVAATDLVATYAPPSGPLKKITAPNFFGAGPWAIRALTPADGKLAYFTGASTAALTDLSAFGRTLIDDADAAAARATLGLVPGTDVQPYSAQLTAIAANSTNGFWARSGSGTGAARTMTGTASQIGVTNGDGVSGNPVFALLGNTLALSGLSGAANKIAYFTGAAAMALADFTAFARTLVAATTVAEFFAALGVTSSREQLGTFDTRTAAIAATIPAAVKEAIVQGYTTVGLGGASYVRTSLVTITAGGYPAASYFRSADRYMPDGSTDATNGGYWLNASEVLTFEQFGAVGDATVTNDSAAIIAAILFAKLTGRLLRPVGAYRVQEKIVINCDGFDGTLCTLNVYSTPAIACEISTGDAANPVTIFSQSVGRHIKTPVLINMTKPASGWASQGIGLRLVNCQNVEITLNVITNFAIGVQLTSYTQSCLHNKLFITMLLNNKVNVQLVVGDAGGSTNSNLFIGGHYVHYSEEGTAVSGCRHVEVVPHATRSIINHTVFDGASLEGVAEDYHVYDGGQQNSYINCRWETPWASGGPRFRQGQSATPQAGQGGDHVIVYGYGVDEYQYLTITNDTSATTRITVLGNGLGRRSSSGSIDLQTSVGSGEPVYRGFSSADNLNTIDRTARWSWHLSNIGLSGKQTADVYARATFDFVNGGMLFGNGTAAPAAGTRAFGTSSVEVVGHTYWAAKALNAGNVGGYGTLSYMDDNKWKTVLATGTLKTFVVSDSASWTAMTGTGSKAALAAAAAGTASAGYVQSELQGALNRIAAMEARLKSYDDAFFASNLIS